MSRFPASVVGVFFLPYRYSWIGLRMEKLEMPQLTLRNQRGAIHEVVSWTLSAFIAFIPSVSSMISCIVIVDARLCDVNGVISTLDIKINSKFDLLLNKYVMSWTLFSKCGESVKYSIEALGYQYCASVLGVNRVSLLCNAFEWREDDANAPTQSKHWVGWLYTMDGLL